MPQLAYLLVFASLAGWAGLEWQGLESAKDNQQGASRGVSDAERRLDSAERRLEDANLALAEYLLDEIIYGALYVLIVYDIDDIRGDVSSAEGDVNASRSDLNAARSELRAAEKSIDDSRSSLDLSLIAWGVGSAVLLFASVLTFRRNRRTFATESGIDSARTPGAWSCVCGTENHGGMFCVTCGEPSAASMLSGPAGN